jgi:hypothetical protein
MGNFGVALHLSAIHANYVGGIFSPDYLKLPMRIKLALVSLWEKHLEMLYGKPDEKPKGEIDYSWGQKR